jgi:hypothetical protein
MFIKRGRKKIILLFSHSISAPVKIFLEAGRTSPEQPGLKG